MYNFRKSFVITFQYLNKPAYHLKKYLIKSELIDLLGIAGLQPKCGFLADPRGSAGLTRPTRVTWHL